MSDSKTVPTPTTGGSKGDTKGQTGTTASKAPALSPVVDDLLNALGQQGGSDTKTQPPTRTTKPPEPKPPSEADVYEAELKQAMVEISAVRGYGAISEKAKSTLEAMEDSLLAAAAAGGKKDFTGASGALKTAVTQAKEVTAERSRVRDDFIKRQGELDTSLEEATKRAGKLASQPPLVTDAVQAAREAQTAAEDAGDATPEHWPVALKTLPKLAETIDALGQACTVVGNYQEARAKLARKEASVAKITDTSGKKKTLKDAYLVEVARVQAQLDKGKFKEAQDLLPDLEKALDPTFVIRQKDIEKASQKKIDKASKSQTKGPLGIIKVYKDVGSKSWTKMVDNILDVQLDPDFQDNYDKICDQVADDIANDPIVRNAKKKWDKWMKKPEDNKDKIEEFMNQVVIVQSKRLGSDPPPVSTKQYERKSTVGSFSSSTGKITLNPENSSNQDFEELLDTLTHENTHAYQTLLINRLDGPVTLKDGTVLPRLKSGDPDYNAAKVLKLNDYPGGYINSANAEKYPNYDSKTNDPYEKQCCEVHAYRAGEKTGKAAYAKMKNI